MLEFGRLQRVFLHRRHLDDALFALARGLVRRSVSNVLRIGIGLGNVFGLGGFDFAMGDALEREPGAFGRFVDGSVIGTLHAAVFICEVVPVGKRDEVWSLALLYGWYFAEDQA